MSFSTKFFPVLEAPSFMALTVWVYVQFGGGLLIMRFISICCTYRVYNCWGHLLRNSESYSPPILHTAILPLLVSLIVSGSSMYLSIRLCLGFVYLYFCAIIICMLPLLKCKFFLTVCVLVTS